MKSPRRWRARWRRCRQARAMIGSYCADPNGLVRRFGAPRTITACSGEAIASGASISTPRPYEAEKNTPWHWGISEPPQQLGQMHGHAPSLKTMDSLRGPLEQVDAVAAAAGIGNRV